jgi:trigger factor
VPLSIIRQRYGSDLLKEATQKIMQRTWKDAVAAYDLKPLAEPEVKEVDDKPGGPLKFTLSFEVFPTLEVKGYKGVSVTLSPVEITEDKIDKALEELRDRHAEFVPVEGGEAKDGLYLTVTVDGQFEDAAKSLHEEDVTLILGHPQTDTGFSDNLRGAKSGETRIFDVDYPADYHRKHFAGKRAHYTVVVKDIKEKQLPELNEDFAKDIGSESLDALRVRVRDEMVREAREDAEKRAREALLDSIMQSQSAEVPEYMIQEELEARVNRVAGNLARQGININQTSIDWKKVFEMERPQAEKDARRSLFLEMIARQEGIEVTKEEVDLELQKIAEGTTKSAAALRAQLEKDERIQVFEQRLRQNKALDFIYRNANIT